VKGAAHADEARAWLDFLKSEQAQAIFMKFGFGRYSE